MLVRFQFRAPFLQPRVLQPRARFAQDRAFGCFWMESGSAASMGCVQGEGCGVGDWRERGRGLQMHQARPVWPVLRELEYPGGCSTPWDGLQLLVAPCPGFPVPSLPGRNTMNTKSLAVLASVAFLMGTAQPVHAQELLERFGGIGANSAYGSDGFRGGHRRGGATRGPRLHLVGRGTDHFGRQVLSVLVPRSPGGLAGLQSVGCRACDDQAVTWPSVRARLLQGRDDAQGEFDGFGVEGQHQEGALDAAEVLELAGVLFHS